MKYINCLFQYKSGILLLALFLLFNSGCSKESSPQANAQPTQPAVKPETNNAPTLSTVIAQATNGSLNAVQSGKKPITDWKGLRGFQLPDGTLQITSGFPVQTNMEVPFQYNFDDSGDIEVLDSGGIGIRTTALTNPDTNSDSQVVLNAIDTSWRFTKAMTSFHVGDYVYTALQEGSTVSFTKDGVLLAGFKITPFSVYKNDHSAGTAAKSGGFDALPANWPNYSGTLTGSHEVRVNNPNDFKVRVGLRSAGNGINFIVWPNTYDSVNVPNGQYDIYFQYESDPTGLYQGDSFTVADNGVEITITKVVNGNYGIRKVN